MSNIQKRYQVFVSSTYEDLKEERMEVLHALLELDCIPCGMEYFPASSESQWKYIMQLIDNCDYYMVILGNRYGSEAEDGKSYTQKEYEYAVSRGIPVIGFFHRNPESLPFNKSESDPGKQEKLKQFTKQVQSRLAKPWENAKDLGGVVSRSLVQEMKRNPRVGWIRANELEKLPTNEEMVKVMRENKNLKEKVEKYVNTKSNLKDISSGEDEVEIHANYVLLEKIGEKLKVQKIDKVSFVTNWDVIFKYVSKAIRLNIGWQSVDIGYILCSIAVAEHIGKNMAKDEKAYINISEPSAEDVTEHLQALSLVTWNNLRLELTAKGESRYFLMNALRKGETRFVKEVSINYDFSHKKDIGDYKIGEIFTDSYEEFF